MTGSYQEAEKALKKLLGVEVHYKQIQRDCLKVGADLAQVQKQEAAAALEVKERPDDPPPAKAGPDCVMVLVDGTIVDRHSQHEGSGLEVKVGRVDVACLQTSAPAPEATPGNAAGTPTPANTERQQELAQAQGVP